MPETKCVDIEYGIEADLGKTQGIVICMYTKI